MIDIDAKLNTFLSQNFETEVLEFKEAKNNFDFDALGKYFSALSNEANLKGHDEAWLIFGVKDKDKSIVGTQFRADQAKLHTIREIAVMMHRDLAKYGATIANFATVQNPTIQEI